jgi:TfoX/Sxy family transcriptional regulator of competence genes
MPYNESLAERMRIYLKSRKGLVEKKMFGGIGFMLNGNMACGINKDDLIVRLGTKDYEKALNLPHVRAFNMGRGPMNGWIMISPEGYVTDKALFYWLDKGLKEAGSLPAK